MCESGSYELILDGMKLILQGLTAHTHTAELNSLFDVPELQSVICSVAFVNEGGVTEIEERMNQFASRTMVIAGIRNGITSYQGLRRLRSIIGNRLYVFDTGTRYILFHPKLYLAVGNLVGKLIIGSANLTLGGLSNNVEASVIADFDITVEEDKRVIDEISEVMTGLPDEYPAHVTQIRSDKQIEELLTSGRIVDENQLPPVTPANLAPDLNADTIPPIKLKVPTRRRKLTKARLTPPAKPQATPVTKASVDTGTLNLGRLYDLVWESKPLTRRDLTIPDEAGTNPTGSINLDKGLLADEIDHRHYFRDELFDKLTWTPRRSTVDEASAKFVIVLKGISLGEFDLSIHHTTSQTSAAYIQNNAMTRLSWGSVRTLIARPDLIGRALRLYQNRSDTSRYLIEID